MISWNNYHRSYGLLRKYGTRMKSYFNFQLFFNSYSSTTGGTVQPEIVETKSSDGRSVISSSAVAAIVERLKFERNRSFTRRNYHTIWKIFSDFYLRLDERPDNWEDRIVLFTAYLINKNRKVATVKSYVSAIKSVLREDKITISDDRFLLNSLIKAC